MALPKESLQLTGIRGATTSQSNEAEAMDASVTELVEALVERNKLKPEQIVSITFSVTKRVHWEKLSISPSRYLIKK